MGYHHNEIWLKRPRPEISPFAEPACIETAFACIFFILFCQLEK